MVVVGGFSVAWRDILRPERPAYGRGGMVDCRAASPGGVVYNTCMDSFCSSNSHFCPVAQYQLPIHDRSCLCSMSSPLSVHNPIIVNCCTSCSPHIFGIYFPVLFFPRCPLVHHSPIEAGEAGPARHMFRDSGARPLSSPARARGRNASLWMGFDMKLREHHHSFVSTRTP